MKIEYITLETLKPHTRNARTHSRAQVKQIADSIKAFGFLVPILADEGNTVLAGHGRLNAAKALQLKDVPVVRVEGLSEARKRALMLADNKITANAGWDRQRLALELPELANILIEEELDISVTGFAVAEIDQLVVDFEDSDADPADDIVEASDAIGAVTKPGDLWLLGPHRLVCGDARDAATLERLMSGEQAAAAFLDPPFNVKVSGIGGRGSIQHPEFAMASGEMSREEFTAFLDVSLGVAARILRPGAVHFVCIDWRHVSELIEAGRSVYNEFLNLCVWEKTNGGQGSLYRSQHELVGVFRVGDTPHLNNVQLGKFGRNRSNIWKYAGVNSFGAGRMADLASHPTVKPTQLVADAIKDVTRRGDVVLDTFCGSGTTILAAEKVGRRGYGIEYEPRFVDVAIRRWQSFTGKDAVHAETGMPFDEASGLAFKRAA